MKKLILTDEKILVSIVDSILPSRIAICIAAVVGEADGVEEEIACSTIGPALFVVSSTLPAEQNVSDAIAIDHLQHKIQLQGSTVRFLDWSRVRILVVTEELEIEEVEATLEDVEEAFNRRRSMELGEVMAKVPKEHKLKEVNFYSE